MQSGFGRLLKLSVLAAPWGIVLLGTMEGRPTDPWQLLDSQSRPRVRVEEGPDGAFELLFLDGRGEKRLSVGTSGDGSPILKVSKGASSLVIAPEAESGELQLTLEGATTRTLLTRFGVAVFEGRQTPRLVLNLSEKEMKAEVFLEGRGGGAVVVGSDASKSSLVMGEARFGVEVTKGKESLWLGSPPRTAEQLKNADGVSLMHTSGVGGYISMKAGKGSKRLYLHSSATAGSGLHVGDEGVDRRLRLGVPSGQGVPLIEAIDESGVPLWKWPLESK